MICASVEHLDRHKGMSQNLDRAIEWIQSGAWKERTEEGKLVIDGERVFAGFDRYESKLPSEGLLETHRRHIDIQMVVTGSEYVEVRPDIGLEVAVPYVDDVEFQSVPADPSHQVVLTPGTALILFPEDSHRPGLALGGVKEPVFKMVVKILIEE